MTENAKTFPNAQLRCTQSTLELQPSDTTPALRGEVVTVMECNDDKCVPGHDPRIREFKHNLPVQITQVLAGPSLVLLARIAGIGSVSIPVAERSILDEECSAKTCPGQECRGLCQKLVEARDAAKLPKRTKYFVYMITEDPGELALKGKLIAIPLLPGQPGNPLPPEKK